MAEVTLVTVPIERYWLSSPNYSGRGRPYIPEKFGVAVDVRKKETFTGNDGEEWKNTYSNALVSSGYPQLNDGLVVSTLTSLKYEGLMVGYSRSNAVLTHVIGFSALLEHLTDQKNNPSFAKVGGIWTDGSTEYIYKLDRKRGNNDNTSYCYFEIPRQYKSVVHTKRFAGIIAQCNTDGSGSKGANIKWKMRWLVPAFVVDYNDTVYEGGDNEYPEGEAAVIPVAKVGPNSSYDFKKGELQLSL